MYVWAISMADPAAFVPDAILANDYELEAAFRLITEVQMLDLTSGEHLYLDTALKLRTGRAAR